MKKSFIKISAYLIISIGVFIACEKSSDVFTEEQNQEVNPEPTEDALLPTELSQTNVEVAKIQKDGHEFSFIALGDDDELAITETLYGDAIRSGKLRLTNFKNSTPFDLFVEITDQNVAVPHRIAITTDKSVLDTSGRIILNKNSEMLKIEDPDYHLLSNMKAGVDVGSATFQNDCCDFPLTSTANNIEFCLLGPFTSRTRNSRFGGNWENVNYSYGKANNIGDIQRIRHYAWENSQWVLKFRHDFNGSLASSWVNSSTDTERRVVFSRPTGTGTTRGFVRFIDN